MAEPIDNLREVRKEKLKKLRDLGVEPYPSKYPFESVAISVARDSLKKNVSVRGRLMSVREHGNILFADLQDESAKIQLLFQKTKLGDLYDQLKLFDVGDFLGVNGKVGKTKAGELTVEVDSFMLLSKSIRPLPDQWSGLKDEETRYRQRYLDLLLNPDLRELFRKKAIFWNTIRNFMIEKGFLEVETPVLETTAGGADANPFVTHHDALDIDLYLRISMGELWQKRLMVAGFEKTFEIGRQFRNEGLSREHLQDYTQMEFYWSYANFEDGMKLVQELYTTVAQKTFGKLKFEINGHQVDFSGKWERIDYVDTIKKHTGIDVTTVSENEMRAKLKELKVTTDAADRKERLIDLLWKTVRKGIAGPVFLVGHPVEVSPLAKRIAQRPQFVEQYQIILAGSEMGKGYSELNDPIDQAERFVQQQELRDNGDEEAQMFDDDFVRALEYGMPPVTGFGVSERLFSFLADLSIREAVLFPLLRPEDGQEKNSHQDFSKKLVIVIDESLPEWQIMNTSAHAAAFLGNKMTSEFDTGKYFITKDGVNLPRNSQYAIVTLAATKDQLKELMPAVRKSKLLHLGYVPEMMETTDDADLEKKLSEKNESEIVYTGIGIFGPKEEVDKLTKKFPLWGKESMAKQPAKSIAGKQLKISREAALNLVREKMKNENLVRHSLSVEAVMRALAEHFGGDIEKWGILGLLHDSDYEETKEDIEKHTLLTISWLKDHGEEDEELIRALQSHNAERTGFPGPDSLMEWSLFCCDELTGLIVATTLMQPTKKLADTTVDSVMRKWTKKGFAAGAKREDIEQCVDRLGIPVEEFVGIALSAMQKIAPEIGL